MEIQLWLSIVITSSAKSEKKIEVKIVSLVVVNTNMMKIFNNLPTSRFI
jgi:hypothetical protein